MRKRNKGNTPRRKCLKRKKRLLSAKYWIPSYTGKNIVKGYAKWFGVDLLCAIKELRMNGLIVSEDYENEVLKSIKIKFNAAQQKKEEVNNHCNNLDENFELW